MKIHANKESKIEVVENDQQKPQSVGSVLAFRPL